MKTTKRILSIELLKPHEKVSEERVEELLKDMKVTRIIRKPILVDEKTLTVIDGHHRLVALKKLGCKKIPVILVDYRDSKIKVKSWNGETKEFDKDLILERAIKNSPLPPKTTKHVVIIDGKEMHVEVLQKPVNMSLDELL